MNPVSFPPNPMAYKINIAVFVTDTSSAPIVSHDTATDNCPPSTSC